jgi:hypothetical protein
MCRIFLQVYQAQCSIVPVEAGHASSFLKVPTNQADSLESLMRRA